MLRLSKKLLFAIEAVVDIAYHGSADPVRSADISRRQGIPRRYLEQVLQHLVHHNILTGQRGPRGGYRLAREKRRITVGEIIRVVRAYDALTNDYPGGRRGAHLKAMEELRRDVASGFDPEVLDALERCTRHDEVTEPVQPTLA